jgi:hypothetical protein
MARPKGVRKPSDARAAGETIPVTLKAWVKKLGMTTDDLKKLVREVILPELWMFQEWRASIQSQGVDNQSASLQTVIDALRNEFSRVRLSPEELITSKQTSTAMIWSHSVFVIRKHLISITTFDMEFPTLDDKSRAAYDFLLFINKNMASSRCFAVDKALQAEKVRKEKVDSKSQHDTEPTLRC